jgi:hypothetical protein
VQCRAPTIFFWNVAASANGVDETVDLPGVVQLNGFSQSYVRFVLGADHIGGADTPATRPSTADVVAGVLANPAFAGVRDAVAKSHVFVVA